MIENKIAVLCSTGGSVLNEMMRRTSLRIDLLIVDRNCNAEHITNKFDIKLEKITGTGLTNEKISLSVKNILERNSIDYLFLFYTRLLTGSLLTKFKRRIINFHPSLLPSYPGMNGFEDSVASGSLMIGSTAHFVDSGIDTGQQIIQCKVHSVGIPQKKLRHQVFAQQVASLFQLTKSIKSDEFKPFATNQNYFIFLDYKDIDSFSCPKFCDEARSLYFSISGE